MNASGVGNLQSGTWLGLWVRAVDDRPWTRLTQRPSLPATPQLNYRISVGRPVPDNYGVAHSRAEITEFMCGIRTRSIPEVLLQFDVSYAPDGYELWFSCLASNPEWILKSKASGEGRWHDHDRDARYAASDGHQVGIWVKPARSQARQMIVAVVGQISGGRTAEGEGSRFKVPTDAILTDPGTLATSNALVEALTSSKSLDSRHHIAAHGILFAACKRLDQDNLEGVDWQQIVRANLRRLQSQRGSRENITEYFRPRDVRQFLRVEVARRLQIEGNDEKLRDKLIDVSPRLASYALPNGRLLGGSAKDIEALAHELVDRGVLTTESLTSALEYIRLLTARDWL